MEIIFIIGLIGLTVFGVELQYILGSMRTPPGMLYLGTVHWPSDYFYYLSQFIQGKTSWLSSTILYTSEKLHSVYIGWQAVLSGKMLMLLGFNVIQSYQVAVGIYLTVFLSVSYLVMREIFPDKKSKRIIAFFFFISSTSLFQIIHNTNGSLDLGYVAFWYNLGISLARFSPTPHHLTAYSLGAAGFLFTARWFKKKVHSSIDVFSFGFVGLLLASISPVHWGLLVLTAGVMGMVITTYSSFLARSKNFLTFNSRSLKDFILKHPFSLTVKARKFSHTAQKTELFSPSPVISMLFQRLLPAFIIFVSGVPAALYAKYVFSIPPYSYSQAWEATQQIRLTLLDLVRANGIIVVIALFGIFPFIKKLNPARLFVLIFLSLCLLFYMTGIPARLHLTNVRFWPSTIYIVWAVLASEGVSWIGEIVKKIFGLHRIRNIVITIILLIYITSLIPSYIPLYRDVLRSHVNNLYYYIPKETYAAFKEAEKISKPDSIFLVVWPLDEIFPALTGRKSFFGFYLLTIDAENKQRDGFALLDGKLTADQAEKAVLKYKIDYILVYANNKYVASLPFLKKIYGNNLMDLYQVNAESF